LLGFQSHLTSGSFGGLRSGQGSSLTSFIGQLGGFSLGDAGIASHPEVRHDARQHDRSNPA
jgi:hypothetical protein